MPQLPSTQEYYPSSRMAPILNFLSIDPGDVHQGIGYFEIDWTLNVETNETEPTLWRHWTRDLDRATLFELAETADVDAFIIEAFRLYPELAREQGYSEFLTPQTIGVLRYIARRRHIPYFIQGADVKKKARRIGERLGFPGSIRMLGSGRYRYRGWDFQGPSQHERDATGHGVWWAFNHPKSSVNGLHHKRKCRLEIAS